MQKSRFKDARRKATEAFSNEALSAYDRLLAMQFRVISTLLQKNRRSRGRTFSL